MRVDHRQRNQDGNMLHALEAAWPHVASVAQADVRFHAVEGFVSGYGFSRIEKDQTTIGFSRWPQRLKADRICSPCGTPEGMPDTNRDAMIFRPGCVSIDHDERFVSGYGFSRIEKDQTTIGFAVGPSA